MRCQNCIYLSANMEWKHFSNASSSMGTHYSCLILKMEEKKKKLKEQMNTELKAEIMSKIRERHTQIPSFFLAQIVKFFCLQKELITRFSCNSNQREYIPFYFPFSQEQMQQQSVSLITNQSLFIANTLDLKTSSLDSF